MKIVKELAFKFHETAVIIDGKGDTDLINKVKQLDNNAFIWTIGSDIQYNPFASKDKIILTDTVMSLFDFSEQYYKDLAQNYLILLIDTQLANNIDWYTACK